MRTHLRKTLFIGAAILWFITASGLSAQTPGEPKASLDAPSRIDFAFAYSAARSNAVGSSSFWMQGGSVQMHLLFYRALGMVFDFSGWHAGNIKSSGVSLDLVTSTSGLRYTWQPAHTRYFFYGQALAGFADGFHSDFPTNSGAITSFQSLALKLGGGLNIALTPRIGMRALEASWLRTQFPNSSTGTQGSCELNTGVVLRF